METKKVNARAMEIPFAVDLAARSEKDHFCSSLHKCRWKKFTIGATTQAMTMPTKIGVSMLDTVFKNVLIVSKRYKTKKIQAQAIKVNMAVIPCKK